MIEQLSDTGFTGVDTGDASLTSNEKQLPVVVKKQPLRDLPNENNVTITKSVCDSTLPKERVPVKDPDKVSGTKRSLSEVNPPPSQAPSAVNVNGNLVYVRRKTEADIGKISSSGTTGNNNDLQLSVKAPISNERVEPSSILNKPQIDAVYIRHSSETSLNSPALPINFPSETPLPDSLKSGAIMPLLEDTSVLPDPVGKSDNTMSSTENKSLLPRPVGISGNNMSSAEDKSLHPHPLGMSGNNAQSTENKSPLHPLGKAGNTTSVENKSPVTHPVGNSDVLTASVEIRSSLPRLVGNPGVINPSVENRSPIPSLGKSGNIMSSAENNHVPPASVTTKLDFTKESNSKHLQHWHVQPRISLRGLDRSAHEEYLQMLRSLSSVELSRLAFELETRSIQLSLEEAREMARVEMLNVMGKSSKPFKSPTALLEK